MGNVGDFRGIICKNLWEPWTFLKGKFLFGKIWVSFCLTSVGMVG